MLLAGQTAL